MRLALALLCCVTLAFGAFGAPLPPSIAGKVQRIKSAPKPLVVSNRTISVKALSAEREDLQWPIARFASNVAEEFGDFFTPLGSADFPLAINLGSSTNEVTTLSRQVFRVDEEFSHLIIGVPNPETVDLEELRVAIVEAQLRERARALKGSYGDFHWPLWFVKGMVDSSLGNAWQAEAYESVYRLLQQQALPEVTGFFSREEAPPREVGALFARWVLELNCTAESVYQRALLCDHLIVAPWDGALLKGQGQKAFEAWIRDQQFRVFLPGTLLLSQFERWKGYLAEPTSAEEAQAISQIISRFTIMRPRIFRDLSTLYLRAYVAFSNGDPEAYARLRAEADASAKLLEDHLRRSGPILDEAFQDKEEK